MQQTMIPRFVDVFRASPLQSTRIIPDQTEKHKQSVLEQRGRLRNHLFVDHYVRVARSVYIIWASCDPEVYILGFETAQDAYIHTYRKEVDVFFYLRYSDLFCNSTRRSTCPFGILGHLLKQMSFLEFGD